MSTVKLTHAQRIDSLMEQASRALVARRYFETERLCVEALDAAHVAQDYDRMARILLPLQEARRHKRDQAIDTGIVRVLDGVMPTAHEIVAGMYLVQPPRVGLDGRMLREAADRSEIPIVVVVREPTTRTGLCPVVSLGPVTLRARIEPPIAQEPPKPKSSAKSKATKNGKKAEAADSPATTTAAGTLPPAAAMPTPSVEWMVRASELLGDTAIDEIDPTRPAYARVEELLLCVQALPEHEKLHQALIEACKEAIREEVSPARRRDRLALAEELDEDDVTDLDDEAVRLAQGVDEVARREDSENAAEDDDGDGMSERSSAAE